MAIWIVSLIIGATLYLLITEKIPIDLTAIGIIVALMLTRVLTPPEAVAGLANPAVITVGAMFLISRGLIRTGTVGFLGQRVIQLSRGKPLLAMLVILVLVTAASAFINNTPVVVLFIPVVMSMCCEFGLSPSKYLIPISFASILGGTCTLIGTSTNLIVSNLSAAYGHGSIGMFELSVIGMPIALMGLGYLLLAAPKLMPSSLNPICELENSKHRRYLAELHVIRQSPLIGKDAATALAQNYPELEVLELIRYSHIFYPDRDKVDIAADDLLLVKGSANDLMEILRARLADLPPSERGLVFGVGKIESVLVELIIPPQSSMLGQRLMETDLRRDPDLHTIAIQRSGLHYTEQKLHDVSLKIGDILLVWCAAEKLDRMRAGGDVIIVEDIHQKIVNRRKARIATLIFAGLVAAAGSGLADIMVCSLAAVFLMLITGCLQVRDAYSSLQANVLLLIAATIALGSAMEKSGTSQLYAEAFLGLFRGASPAMVLGGFIMLTSFSTQILSNNASAVLLLPVAISTALGLGVDPKPFIIAVCIGASTSFATPIGYQTNLLVYGPGGYRFSDYLKLGVPLMLFVILAGSLLIPIFWPF
jgi:di/tricarboxylate transporter